MKTSRRSHSSKTIHQGMGFFFLFLTVLLFSGLSASAQKATDSIPDFTFYRLDGSAFSKAQVVKGKRSIFLLFDCNCEHCQREIVQIGQHYDEFKDVMFYMVTLDQKPAIEKFMGYYGKYLNGKPNVVVLQDIKMEFIPKFVPAKYPGIFIYDARHKYLFSNSGTTPLKDMLSALERNK